MRCWFPWRREKRGPPSLLDCCPTRDFVVGEYLGRMIELASELAGKSQKVHHITLWWGEDGLELQEDGSVKHIKPSNKLNPLSPAFPPLPSFVPYIPPPTPIFGSCPEYSPYQRISVPSGCDPLTAQINASISAQSMAIAAQMAAATAPITACCVKMEKALQQQTNMLQN